MYSIEDPTVIMLRNMRETVVKEDVRKPALFLYHASLVHIKSLYV